jgi:hypothetical protein
MVGPILMMKMSAIYQRPRGAAPILLAALLLVGLPSFAADPQNQTAPSQAPAARDAATAVLSTVLPPADWKRVEGSVDRGLAWLASQQARDGSFPTLPQGQPGVTSFGVMAFLSRGHQPGRGQYGRIMEKAIDFALSCQMTNGLFSHEAPGPVHRQFLPSHTAVYNHAITGLMLGEVYGQLSGPRARSVRAAIGKALNLTLEMQKGPKVFAFDKGGWRYIRPLGPGNADSDLSVTGWQLMFLRSARNAEFNVPKTNIDEALRYVRGCWDGKKGIFDYALIGPADASSPRRAMNGAGVLSLCLGGAHDDPIALAAGDWLLARPFARFGDVINETHDGRPRDRFFYGAYYCSQAMAQLGGKYWAGFFPPMVKALLEGQQSDGSWPPEPAGADGMFGNACSTALAVLSLTPPYQLLPVYQR